MNRSILVINPGSTSTEMALYEGSREIVSITVEHDQEILDRYETVKDQLAFRKAIILRALEGKGVALKGLACVIGRGGAGLKPVQSGGYEVNALMEERLKNCPLLEHASNLGGLLAKALAEEGGAKAYIYDPVATDELIDIARISGIPQIERSSTFHALNSRTMARKAAERDHLDFREANFIVAHLGGGISLCALERGRAIDICADDEGPFSPERAGAVPCTKLIDLCYKGDFTHKEMKKLFRGKGGLRAYLNTRDAKEAEEAAMQGNPTARLILDALSYQVAKAIGSLATTLCGRVDAIVLTGALARSGEITREITKRVGFIAPVRILPGEEELAALAAGGLRMLEGLELPREYTD